jgi:ParB family chromosome partitioning protein
MPEPKKPAKTVKGGVGELPDVGDTDAVVVKLSPDLTQKGLAMVGDFRTDALHQALDDSIPAETLIGLLVLALGTKNVTVETGRLYGSGDREVIRDRISEGGVLTVDHDVLHAAARDMLKIMLSCRANMTDSGVSSRVAGETLGAATYLPTMATDEFLSCLSRQALERSATADGVKVEIRVKDTRASLVKHFDGQTWHFPGALFPLTDEERANAVPRTGFWVGTSAGASGSSDGSSPETESRDEVDEGESETGNEADDQPGRYSIAAE